MEPVFAFCCVSDAVPAEEVTWSRDGDSEFGYCWVASAWGVSGNAMMHKACGREIEHLIEELVYLPILQLAVSESHPCESESESDSLKDDSDSEELPSTTARVCTASRSAILHLTNHTANHLIKMIPFADGYQYCKPCSSNCITYPQFVQYAFEDKENPVDALFEDALLEDVLLEDVLVEDALFDEPIFIRHVELLPRSVAMIGAGHRDDELYIYCPPGSSVRVRAVWYANGRIAASARQELLIR
jgi:hypothetical protein